MLRDAMCAAIPEEPVFLWTQRDRAGSICHVWANPAWLSKNERISVLILIQSWSDLEEVEKCEVDDWSPSSWLLQDKEEVTEKPGRYSVADYLYNIFCLVSKGRNTITCRSLSRGSRVMQRLGSPVPESWDTCSHDLCRSPPRWRKGRSKTLLVRKGCGRE